MTPARRPRRAAALLPGVPVPSRWAPLRGRSWTFHLPGDRGRAGAPWA